MNWPHFPAFAWGGSGAIGLALALGLRSGFLCRWDLVWVGYFGGFFGGQVCGVAGWQSGDGVEGVRMFRIFRPQGGQHAPEYPPFCSIASMSLVICQNSLLFFVYFSRFLVVVSFNTLVGYRFRALRSGGFRSTKTVNLH